MPELSMLWEADNPAVVLRERFGFAEPADAVTWMGATLHDHWGVGLERCDRLVMSSGNALAWVDADGERLIVKWSVVPEMFRRLADTTALTVWLQGRGVPVAVPVAAADGRHRVEVDGVSLCVCPVIGGDLLDVGDPEQVSEAGRVLARLHGELASYPGSIDGARPTGRAQLVQNDFRSANILRDPTGITAVLDFEDATHRTRVADLARAAVLLGTRYHDWAPTSQAVRAAFVAAYQEQAPLTSSEEVELLAGLRAVMERFGWT